MSPEPFGPRAPECPKSVPRVSPECQKGVPDTPGTLSGHFGHSGARGPKGSGDTPSDTPSDTPHFWGHSRGHSGDTSGPKGPRDSCSRPAGSQTYLASEGHVLAEQILKTWAGFISCQKSLRESPGESPRVLADPPKRVKKTSLWAAVAGDSS